MSKDKKPTANEDLSGTLLRLAQPGVSSKELLKEVQKAHPSAKKRDIILAAFASLIDIANSDGEKARRLHDLAISERQPGGEA